MKGEGRVVTANLPQELVEKLDLWAGRLDRTKSWIIRQAVNEWIVEEQRRHELTLEALKDVDEGRTHTQAEIEAMGRARNAKRRAATEQS